MIESLAWFAAAMVGAALIFAANLLRGRRRLLIAQCSALLLAMLILIGPRCMCTELSDQLVMAAVGGIVLGMVISLLLTVIERSRGARG